MRIAVAGGTGTVGRHVVAHAQKAGHQAAVLSPSQGVDVRSGEGLADALNGADVVIDVTNSRAFEQGPATQFWTDVAGALQRTGAEKGVRHIVTLSIVGIEKTSFGYYAAKLEHERAAASGPVPSTVMRATQLHELPAQLISMTRQGSQAQVLDLGPVQPVAARTVAGALLELAEAAPCGRAPDLAGPQEADFVALARAFVQHRGEAITVHPDSDSVAGIPPGALLPENDARLQGPTFEEWLGSDDAAALAALCPGRSFRVPDEMWLAWSATRWPSTGTHPARAVCRLRPSNIRQPPSSTAVTQAPRCGRGLPLCLHPLPGPPPLRRTRAVHLRSRTASWQRSVRLGDALGC